MRPLYLNESVEARALGHWGHGIRRHILKLIPPLKFYLPPRGRPSVISQLEQRPEFPSSMWTEHNSPDDVVAVLKIISGGLNLPNHNFIPEDPLGLIMSSGTDPLDEIEALMELEEKYHVKYTNAERRRISLEEWTLGEFVNDLLERRDQMLTRPH